MDFRSQMLKNAVASEQATSTPSGCKACQRKGLPIYPLRVAAVPHTLVNTGWRPDVPQQEVELTGSEFKYALRTLRMGYVYVLLDKRIWQGYQVTAKGYLRQFNPFNMPESESVEPLSESCAQHGHDVSASFINIDDKKYSEAWLAFSRDPWSKEVLEEYKSERRPVSRFTKISLPELKNNPASIPAALVMDPQLSSMKANVAEFATEYFFNNPKRLTGEPDGGVHGFFPRTDIVKQRILELKISHFNVEYQCRTVALALNDSVGVIQELNNSRMQIAEARQEYLELPGVFHRHMISEAICQYHDNIKTEVVNNPRQASSGPGIGGGYPRPVPWEKTFSQQTHRLLENYDEPARASFAAEFEERFTSPEKQLAAIDTDLAAWYQAPGWQTIITHDYSPDSSAGSWAAQMLTLAACVQGGAMGKDTLKVWALWLEKADSPAYQGFTGMDTSLLNTVFNYGNYKAAATSDEFGQYLKGAAIQRSWAIRMLAVTGSAARLGKSLAEAPRKGFMWMMQAAMLTAGESVVVLRYQTTFRGLQKHLRHSASLRQAMSQNGPVLRLTGGSMSVVDEIQGMRGKGLDTPLWVEFSAPGTLAKLQSELPGLTEKPFNNPAVLDELHNVYLSELSLAEKGATGPVLKATYAQIAKYGELSRRLVSGDGAGLILGAGLLAMQWFNWRELTERLNNSVGTDKDLVADMAINTLLMMEGFSELSGFAYKLALKKNWVVLSAAEQVPAMVRFGAVLGGIAGIIEGFGTWADGWDAYKTGDTGSIVAYGIGGAALIAGGLISGFYGAQGIFTLTSTVTTGFLGLGPAGWAAILLISGAMLAYVGSELRSKAFEVWLRRTCFGIELKRHGNDIVWHANSLEDLAEALIDYRAIVSGMVADVAFASAFSPTGRTTLEGVVYERIDLWVSMPGWAAGKGGWSVHLARAGDDKVLFSQSVSAPGQADRYQAVEPSGYYKYRLSVDEETVTEGGKERKINSLNLMVSVWAEQSRTAKVKLVANYWPDNTDADYQLGLTVSKQG